MTGILTLTELKKLLFSITEAYYYGLNLIVVTMG